MNSAYLLPKASLEALEIRGMWHASAIVGDPQDRWMLLVEHSDDESAATVAKAAGVVALPDVMSRTPVGLNVAGTLSRASPTIGATDTVADVIEKMRAAGWPMAKLRW
jgi:hypothetical protein